MSWAALPVEPACMGKVGEGTRRPPMFVGLADQIDEVVYLVKIILEEMEGKDHGESS